MSILSHHSQITNTCLLYGQKLTRLLGKHDKIIFFAWKNKVAHFFEKLTSVPHPNWHLCITRGGSYPGSSSFFCPLVVLVDCSFWVANLCSRNCVNFAMPLTVDQLGLALPTPAIDYCLFWSTKFWALSVSPFFGITLNLYFFPVCFFLKPNKNVLKNWWIIDVKVKNLFKDTLCRILIAKVILPLLWSLSDN